MCYLQIKMPNLAYFYKNKLDWGKGDLLIQSCLFSIFDGNHCLIANTVWSYCNNLTKRKFARICMVKK